MTDHPTTPPDREALVPIRATVERAADLLGGAQDQLARTLELLARLEAAR